MTIPLLIDTDPGIDDALAILSAARDPALDLLALTTVFGNVPVSVATRNARGLAALCPRPPLVAEGAARPLVRAPAPHPDFVHGGDGLGGAPLPVEGAALDPRRAATVISALAEAHRGALVVVAVGPLTNLAEALAADPALPGRVARVIVMGGAVRHPGNVTEAAEANFWQDPHAAAAVLQAPWPLTLVGLDVTECVRLYPDDLAELPATQAVTLLRKAIGFYAAFHRESAKFTGCYLHDPAATTVAADPSLLECRRLRIAVTLEGEAEGAVRESAEGTPVDVALAANAPGIRTRVLSALQH
ncbi:MAG: nucleoside hydrolase [Pseudomonadota bacterium]